MEKTNRILTKTVFDKMRCFIEARTGVYYDDGKQKSFKICLDNRMEMLGVKDYDDYYSLLTNISGKKEFDELLNLLLIKETFFFRDEQQLRILIKNILPELLKRKNGYEIKIWSAGCATGEEAYSIAIATMEAFPCGGIDVSVYATDISSGALKRAKEGVYTKSAMRAIDKMVLNKYFTRTGDRYYLNDKVKQHVRFDMVNLTEPYFPAEGNEFDVIFCKNVIIYFRLETVRKVIHRFYETLAGKGCLFVGHSESLWQISDEFELEEIQGVFLYRKKGKNKITPSVTEYLREEKQGEGVSGRQSSPADIEGLLQADPGSADTHLLAGNRYANMGLYDKALKEGMDALAKNDLCAEAYVLIGSIYSKIGEKEKALSSFKRAIYLDNTSVLSYYYLGNLYKDSGLIEQAIKEYKNVVHVIEAGLWNDGWVVSEVFTIGQLKELCARNIELLIPATQGGSV